RQFGVAQQRLRGDAADVEADPAPVLLLDDRRLQPELCRPDRGDISTRARAQDHDVKVFAHVNGRYSPRAGAASRGAAASADGIPRPGPGRAERRPSEADVTG